MVSEIERAALKLAGLDKCDEATRTVAVAIAGKYGLSLELRHLVPIQGTLYVTRDGLLHVAHASGQLNGIVVEEEGETDRGWYAVVSVHRKDMQYPFRYRGRYEGGNRKFGPEMAVKCAEVMAMRRAFDIGLCAAEERWDVPQQAEPDLPMIVAPAPRALPEPTPTVSISESVQSPIVVPNAAINDPEIQRMAKESSEDTQRALAMQRAKAESLTISLPQQIKSNPEKSESSTVWILELDPTVRQDQERCYEFCKGKVPSQIRRELAPDEFGVAMLCMQNRMRMLAETKEEPMQEQDPVAEEEAPKSNFADYSRKELIESVQFAIDDESMDTSWIPERWAKKNSSTLVKFLDRINKELPIGKEMPQ